MIVHRSRPESQFAIIPNSTLRDPKLSYMARGVLAEILSRPDDWVTTADAMWRRAKSDRGTAGEGRKAIRDAFDELIRAGYLYRQRRRVDGGQFVTDLHVFDISDGLQAWLAAIEFQARFGGAPVDNLPDGDIPAGRTDDHTGSGRCELGEYASPQVAPTTTPPVAGQPAAGQPAVGPLVISTKTGDEELSTKTDNENQGDENRTGFSTEPAEVEGTPARLGQGRFSDSGRPSPRTAQETAAEARRQADLLHEWMRQHPEAAAAIR